MALATRHGGMVLFCNVHSMGLMAKASFNVTASPRQFGRALLRLSVGISHFVASGALRHGKRIFGCMTGQAISMVRCQIRDLVGSNFVAIKTVFLVCFIFEVQAVREFYAVRSVSVFI